MFKRQMAAKGCDEKCKEDAKTKIFSVPGSVPSSEEAWIAVSPIGERLCALALFLSYQVPLLEPLKAAECKSIGLIGLIGLCDDDMVANVSPGSFQPNV